MKKFLLFGVGIALAIAAKAQPVITAANAVPVGFTATINVAAPVNPGSPGANQIWDFSSLQSSAAGTFSRINPADGTGSNIYPTANFAWSLWLGSMASYEYYQMSATDMVQLGTWNLSSPENYTPNPKALFNFPFNFGNAVNDPWATTGGSSGTVVRTYDGHGTLITPFGTYQNVVRVTTTGSASNTVWFNANPVFPIMQTESSRTVVMSNIVNATPENQAEIAVSVYPNPATDYLLVQTPEEVTEIAVFNALGQQAPVSVTGNKVALHNLAAGVYQLTVKTNSGKTGFKRFVKM